MQRPISYILAGLFMAGLAQAQPQRLALYQSHFEEAASQYHIEAALLKAIAWAESAGNPRAVSHKGAIGLMQLMPPTARIYRPVKRAELYDPRTNIMIAARHLVDLKRAARQRFAEARRSRKYEIVLMAAAYNAGWQRVVQYGGVPPYKETRGYVRRVWRYYSLLTNPNRIPPRDPDPVNKALAADRVTLRTSQQIRQKEVANYNAIIRHSRQR